MISCIETGKYDFNNLMVRLFGKVIKNIQKKGKEHIWHHMNNMFMSCVFSQYVLDFYVGRSLSYYKDKHK